MFASLRQNFSAATLAQLSVELLWLFAAGSMVLDMSSQLSWTTRSVVVPVLVFALLILLLNGAFGIYRRARR